jgi:hypothetical protein
MVPIGDPSLACNPHHHRNRTGDRDIESAASKVRSGQLVPHARHWVTLAQLGGRARPKRAGTTRHGEWESLRDRRDDERIIWRVRGALGLPDRR